MRFLIFIIGLITTGVLDTVHAILQLDGHTVSASPLMAETVPNLWKRQSIINFNYTGPTYTAYNFSMPIDHFNTSDNRTYRNRYFINDTYYEPGGPVIMYDYGEGTLTDYALNIWLGEANGPTAPIALARQYHGLVVILEVRYFGFSLPFPLNKTNDSGIIEVAGAPDSWKYDTLEQGLEDTAYFANHVDQGDYKRDNMTDLLPQNTPWIFIGGSFPGVRAANVRARNPETFYASWSSSAPVQAMYDGSSLYNYAEMSLYPNCSTDIKAIVKYTDEVLSGLHGPEAYSNLQHLYYAAISTSTLASYNASLATYLSPFQITSDMAKPFSGAFYLESPQNTTRLFCNALETYNPNATGFVSNDTYLSMVTNPRDAPPSDSGFLATHGNNLGLGLQAYFSAYVAYSDFQTEVYRIQRSRPTQTPIGADGSAWEYIVDTEFGWYQGSNPNNVSIVSKFFNVTYQRNSRIMNSLKNATIAALPERPNTAAWNKLGGWRINATNVMFTSGAFDPWRAGSVFSLETENGAPGYQPSEDIPACGVSSRNPSTRFGIVYPDAVHVPDLGAMEDVYGNGPNTPFERGLALFIKALDVWLPCFGNRTSNGTAV